MAKNQPKIECGAILNLEGVKGVKSRFGLEIMTPFSSVSIRRLGVAHVGHVNVLVYLYFIDISITLEIINKKHILDTIHNRPHVFTCYGKIKGAF